MYNKLFEPITILNLEVKNRLVMAPISNLFATTNGEVTQRSLDYYSTRAKGGVGMVIVEYSNVLPIGKGCIGTMLGVYHDKLIPGLNLLARAIKQNGARAALQVAHAGRQTFPEFTDTPTIKAASSIALPVPGYPVPEELTLAEIEETIEAFGKAAVRVKKAGFDAVEVHGAHGYLPFGFFSPLQNIRKDKYGGSLKNRMRFGLEIVTCIRDYIGRDFPLGYKLSADEYLKGGVTLKESTVFAKELEKAGINWLQCSAGTYESVHHVVPPMYWSNNPNVHLSAAMKEVLSVPVMTLGRHRNPETMDKLIVSGKADMIAMCRQMLCDPEMPNKAMSGKFDEIRQCIGCNEGCHDYFFKDYPITCAINPECGQEAEMKMQPAVAKKTVLVIGGGPAGMEAAKIAAQRGHEVTLFEKDNRLGGQLNVASIPDFKEPIRGYIRYQELQLAKAGVKVKYGKEANVDSVREIAPDTVIVATGAKPIKPLLPGIDKPYVVFAADVISGTSQTGENVIVVGGGYIGCETALFLAQQEKRVTIVEMQDEIAPDAEISHKFALREMLPEAGVTSRVNLKLSEVKDGEVVFSDKNNRLVSLKADSVVLAIGYEPDRHLSKTMSKEFSQVYSIGDCVEARNILGAVHDGAYIARRI